MQFFRKIPLVTICNYIYFLFLCSFVERLFRFSKISILYFFFSPQFIQLCIQGKSQSQSKHTNTVPEEIYSFLIKYIIYLCLFVNTIACTLENTTFLYRNPTRYCIYIILVYTLLCLLELFIYFYVI